MEGCNKIFLVKFKNRIYPDGHFDIAGNIRFNDNEIEYKFPDDIRKYPEVTIHGFKKTSTGYVHTAKKSTAKVFIQDEEGNWMDPQRCTERRKNNESNKRS